MNGKGNWYDHIVRQLNQLKDILSEKDYKKYKLKLLLCVAERVAEFSPQCGQCQLFQQDISTLTQEVNNLIQVASKDSKKAHIKKINDIVSHLQKQHKLVTEGYYLAIGMSIGSAIGVALGAALPNIGMGIPIGIGVGIAIGAGLDAKAKKEGRILCPSDKTAASSPKIKISVIIGLGILLMAGLVAFLLLRYSC